ncbi:hypothetical protein NTE_02656 [Candidatus Nitrososphaera evergladensis SR1]|jgi:hypothetical protein|uniref:Uncharacterized protein n=1 Tax=Candidatus Nitrososphaera evergladensis SR1 TaxID=1459636 RepID=A0A075MZN3_9ARCH|nr:hypothetical protein [Candidatus Nitrososphaera evergladensis]AIF84699.1 hypothetical protein NTE_02656 [Candidatus Nitrososphaera evergladensis SR1]
MMTSKYAGFPVIDTIDLRDAADIRLAVDKVADAYEKRQDEFSFRILLPRGEKLTGKAKKLGMTFQGEFILTIRKRGLVPQVRDLRYVHDEEHYGWLLASPKIFEKFEGRA